MLLSWFTKEDPALAGELSTILKGTIECIRDFSLWVALALAVVLIAVGILINLKFKDKFRTFLTVAISVVVGFSLTLISVLLFLQISRLAIKNELTTNFYLLVGFASLLLIGAITLALLKVFKCKLFKIFLAIFALLFLAFVIVLCVVLPTEDGFAPLGGNGLFVTLSVLLILVIAVCAFLFDNKNSTTNNTKALTYAGICIAISYALSYIKIFDGPQGSSITLASMLPVMLYSYIFGTKRGVLAGLVYGSLQALQDPQIYQPLQVLLDYPIAFASLGLAGSFRGKKFLKGNAVLEFILGIIFAGVLRYVAHVLSGYFVFYSYATYSDSVALQNSPLLYSLVYNSAVLIDALIDVFVGAFLLSSKSMRHQIELINALEKNK